jgi:DNA-binding CsgD family transcriptional regulator
MDSEIVRNMSRSSLETLLLFFFSLRSAKQPEELIQSLGALSEAVFEKDDAKILYCGSGNSQACYAGDDHQTEDIPKPLIREPRVSYLSAPRMRSSPKSCGKTPSPPEALRGSPRIPRVTSDAAESQEREACTGDCKKKDDLCLASLTEGKGLSDSCEEVFNSLLPYVSEAFCRLVQTGEDGGGVPEGSVTLTPREKEVLTWVSKGKGGWEVGEIVGISERTVKFHLQNIYKKLGVINRAQAVTRAIQCNVLQV